jgi:glutamyl-tRNA synthetase
MSEKLSSLLFPHAQPRDEIAARYPSRPAGSVVTRIAPSPTGYLHIGAIYQALINSLLAHQSGNNGVFMVRIEDTDQERLVPEAMGLIINGLQRFGIQIDEGPLGNDHTDI